MRKPRATALTAKNSLVVSLVGFEPTTHCLEGSCSVRLSYRDVLNTIVMRLGFFTIFNQLFIT